MKEILEYEHFLLMKEHLLILKYVLKDIEDGVKIILTDHDWHKLYCCEIGDIFWLNFILKRNWIQQPLEGAALYIGREQIVYSKQVPAIR